MKNLKYFFRGVTRNVLVLGLVSLLTDLSSQMVFPLIPLFLTSLGSGATIVGIVEGAADTTAALLKVFSGYLSDKFKKRKIFVLIGYSFSTVTKPLFALAKSWPVVLVFRVIERIGKGLRDAPRDALVADYTQPQYMGKAYGIQRAMDGTGSVLGAIMALVLFPLLGYQKLFLFAFIPGLLAVLAILFVKEAKQMNHEKTWKAVQDHQQKMPSLDKAIKILPSNLKLFILVAALFGLVNFGYAFLLLKAKGAGATDERAILFYVLFYGIYTLASTPVGILSDRVGRKKMLWIAYALFLVVTLGLAIVTQLGWIIFFFILFGIVFAIVDGTERALVVDLAGKEMKGTALGVFHTAIGIVSLPGGYMLGMLWDKISPQATFLFAFAVGVIIMIIFRFVNTKKQTHV